MYWDDGHMDEGWGIAMMLGMLGIWALVALAVVWVVRSTHISTVPPASLGGDILKKNAEQILDDRLARGDIDLDDFRARLEALKR